MNEFQAQMAFLEKAIGLVKEKDDVVRYWYWCDEGLRQPRGRLAAALEQRLFQRRGSAANEIEIDPGLRRRHVAKLSRAFRGRGVWEEGWRVVHARPHEIEARRKGIFYRVARHEVHPDDPLTVGASCRVRVPNARRAERPGFFRLYGHAGAPRGDVVHTTWNLRHAGVEAWLRKLAHSLDRHGLPFRIEVPTSPQQDLGAADVVASLPGHALKLPELVEVYRTARPHLRPEHPLGLARLAPGVGLARGEAPVTVLGQRLCEHLARVLFGEAELATVPRISPETIPETAWHPDAESAPSGSPPGDLRQLAEEAVRDYCQTLCPDPPERLADPPRHRVEPVYVYHEETQEEKEARRQIDRMAMRFVGRRERSGARPAAGTQAHDLAHGLGGLTLFAGLAAQKTGSTALRWIHDSASGILGRRLPHDGRWSARPSTLDFLEGELGLCWSLIGSVQGPVHLSLLLPALRGACPEADGWTLLALLDLSWRWGEKSELGGSDMDPRVRLNFRLILSQMEQEDWYEEIVENAPHFCRKLSHQLAAPLRERLDDRILSGALNARQLAGYALAFARLFDSAGDPRDAMAAGRALAAKVPPGRARPNDPAWRLLAELGVPELDPSAATARRARRDEALRAVKARLEAPVLVHDADTSLGSGACLLVNAALEAGRRLGDDAALELAVAGLRRLRKRHGPVTEWPTALPSGGAHPALLRGSSGIAWTFLRAAFPDLPLLLIPTWEKVLAPAPSAPSPGIGPEQRSDIPGCILDVPLLGQQKSQWCWAATEQMVRAFHGDRCRQEEVVRHRFQGELPNRPSWPLFHTLEKTRWLRGPLSWNEIRSEIDADSPFAFAWRHRGDGGHIMVATGYVEVTAGQPGLRRWLKVHDPWPPEHGDALWVPYAHYLRGHHKYWRTYLIRKSDSPQPIVLAAEGPRRPPARFPTSWEAASAVRPFLEALARQTADSPDTRLVLSALGKDTKIRVNRRPIRIYDVSLDDLRRHGEKVLEGEAVEAIFAIETGDSRFLTSVTVRRRLTVRRRQRQGFWEISSLGRSHLASTLFSVDSMEFESETLSLEQKYFLQLPTLTPDFALWIPQIYELFIGVEADWPRPHTILVPVYGSHRLGLARGEALPAATVIEALARTVEDPSLDPTF